MGDSDDERKDLSSESGSESSEKEEVQKKKKKKHKKKDKKKKKKKDKDKKKKKDSKKKKKKKSKKTIEGVINQLEYGSRGIVRADNRAHMYEKKEEFLRWLIEIKDKQPSMLNRREEQDFWSMYCEDYNTCTLPEKFYNIGKWEISEAKRRGVKSVQDLYTNDGMTDEERKRMEVLKQRDDARQKIEQARTFAIMEQLKKAKKVDSARFKEIEEEHRARGPETFESIALKRKRAKEAKEAAITKKLRGF
ncbi:hypothetical protein AAMO2058_001590000 [Amorphochlora amoebiformis]